MEKCKLVLSSSASLDSVQLNWDACCLCQIKGTDLTCPANNPVASRRNAGYRTLAENLEKILPFQNFKLESGFPLKSLIVDTDIFTSLKEKKAKWHKSCALLYQAPKVNLLIDKLKQSLAESPQGSSTKPSTSEPRKTRSTLPLVNAKLDICFLCKKTGNVRQPLHNCATKSVYQNVKRCAMELHDTELLAVLAEGDLIAMEAKYHLICLSRLYNRSNRKSCASNKDYEITTCEGIAFADLLIFIQQKLQENSGYTFKMGTLSTMYHERLSFLLGVAVNDIVHEHETRFREKILAHFSCLEAFKSGREYGLKMKSSNLLAALPKEDQDDDALHTQYFLKRVRKSVHETKVSFDGSFSEDCEESSVPSPLLAVVNSLLYGSPVHNQCRATPAALTICQLVMFNFCESIPKGTIIRNKKNREPPLPMYLALSLYGKGRDKAAIDELHKRGICVSSNRVMEVTSQLCRLVVEQSKEKNVVSPGNLRHDLFTVTAVDNIDHATTSTTSKGPGFHGTGISVFQLPDNCTDGRKQTTGISFNDVKLNGLRSVPELPDFYAEVPDCILVREKPQFTARTEDASSFMINRGNYFTLCVI